MARTSIEYTGTLSSWKDDRGFGFVDLGDGSKPLFVHISAFVDRSVRPIDGDVLRFSIAAEEDGATRAARVRISERASGQRPTRRSAPRSESDGSHRGRRNRRGGKRPGATATLVALVLFAIVWAVCALQWGVAWWIAPVYAVASVIAFFAYWGDKRAARDGRWRTPEATLLTIGLAGGWPGAILAQQLFRHKTTKPAFRSAFWTTVVLNVAAFALLAWL